jgi:hypothetical protein
MRSLRESPVEGNREIIEQELILLKGLQWRSWLGMPSIGEPSNKWGK